MTQQEMTSDLLDLLISTPVEQRWSVLRDSGKPLEELHAMMLEVSNRTMVDLKSAKNSGKVVVGLADVTNDSLCMAKARRTLSRVLAYASEYDCAIETANEGSQIALQGGLQEEAARGQLASMHALTEMGRFDEAAQVGKEARVIFNELDLPAMSARADINLGVVYQHMGQPEKSIICLQRAKDGVADEPNILGHSSHAIAAEASIVDAEDKSPIFKSVLPNPRRALAASTGRHASSSRGIASSYARFDVSYIPTVERVSARS
ncbi:MAG TPA: tetratricopeptide repeat protein, partial [Phycisphaerales bacterium]|nr:tetratricopeptide repeat protein [Phycisphaerales bacterium]